MLFRSLPGPLAGKKLGDDLSVEIVFDDRLFVVAGLQSRWARRRRIELAELADEPWLLPPPGSWADAFLAAAFGAKGLPTPKAKVATYSLPLLHGLHGAGKFIGVSGGLTLRLTRPRLEIKALPIDLPDWPWPLAIVMLKNRTLSSPVNLFVEHVRAFMASLDCKTDKRRTSIRP